MNGYPYDPPARRRRMNPVLLVLALVMAVGAPVITAELIMTVDGGADVPPSPIRHRAGAAVADGHFIFHVAGVRLRERIESAAGTDTAMGGYVLVSLDVTSRDSKPRYVFADDQKLLAGGKAYDADTSATVDSDEGPEVGLPEKINPGATERIVVVYDVPTSATLQAVELHGAAGSVGALVTLPTA